MGSMILVNNKTTHLQKQPIGLVDKQGKGEGDGG